MSRQLLVASYFTACNNGDASAIARHFCEDAVVYDTNHKPVRGATEIGEFYVRVREQWGGAVWEVNTYVEDANAAAIEWSMRGKKDGQPFTFRGSEHYEFRNGSISEIRQYWTFKPEDPDVGLRGFPYQSDERFAAFARDAQTI